MEIDASFRVLHVLLDSFACVACVVVHRQVQLFVTAVGSAQYFEQFDQQLAVHSPVTQWKRPVLKVSAPLIHTLRLVPGVLSRLCSPFRIQQKPTLGLISSLVSSWKKVPAFSTIERMPSSLARFCFAALRSLCRVGPDAAFSSKSQGDGARGPKPSPCSPRPLDSVHLSSDESPDVIGYIEGWCDAQYENTREEFEEERAERNVEKFTGSKFDYLDILSW